MIAFLKKSPHCQAILVEKTDRLYRNIKDWVIMEEIDREIHFVKENQVLSRDSRSTDKFIHGIKVLMAKNYIENLSEETKKGQLEKAEQGIYPSYAPLWYVNVGNNGKRIIASDPDTVPLIRQMFELYATGEYSLLSLTDQMNENGLFYRKSGNKVNKSLVHRVLRNPLYCELPAKVYGPTGTSQENQRKCKSSYRSGGRTSCHDKRLPVIPRHPGIWIPPPSYFNRSSGAHLPSSASIAHPWRQYQKPPSLFLLTLTQG